VIYTLIINTTCAYTLIKCYEMKPQRSQKTISLPRKLLDEVKKKAEEKGLTVTGYIRTVCLKEVHSDD
jgi:predicted DNA binding CopG/RHH family protein